ncbi:MAG TPA: lysylphosphatidylglycerol synthase domain-containing protein [Haliangiales bacterium]|nr:lysylphosphatidylglycerol synthase domain-containing protein [Haliangiales bacterium]
MTRPRIFDRLRVLARRLRPLLALWRVLPLAVLVVVVAVFRDEIARAAARMLDLRPIVFAIIPLYILWNHIAGYSWQSLIAATAPDQPKVPALRLALLRLQSQAINMAIPALIGLGGGALRIGLTRRVGLASAAAAAVLDDIAGGVGGLLFVAGGVLLHSGALFGIPYPTIAAIFGGVGVALWLATVFGLPAVAARIRPERALGQAARVLAHNRRRLVPAFTIGSAWHLAERVLCAGEIYLAFLALGAPAGIADAAFVHAMSVAVGLLLFFLPGQPGAADAAIAAACATVGLDPSTGLTVALVRRARTLAVIGAGLLSLAVMRRAEAVAPVAEAEGP